jgi:hypothetical protein
MAVKEKKKTKKTKKIKQKGGLSQALSTIFKIGPNTKIVRNTANKVLWEPLKLEFIKEIKELLVSQQYQGNNIPVFYGNQLEINKTNKINGYNEYICKTILGRFGGISSRRRIFIINPFAALVYRMYILCIFNNYINNLPVLKELLNLSNFKGFPKLIYLPYGIRFCIVKDINGVEKVITSQDKNYSSCNSVSGCSLIMSAEIRNENLPSDEDIRKLYYILENNERLRYYYDISINKTEYDKMLQNDYFEGICVLLLTLNKNNNRNSLISTITFLEQLYNELKEKLNDLYNHIKSNQISLNEAKRKFIIYKKMKSESVKLKNINKLLTVSNRNTTSMNTTILKQQNHEFQKQMLIDEITKLFNEITKLEELYEIVKYNNPQSIHEIIKLLKSDKRIYQQFLLFLETKPIEKSIILQILQNAQRLQNSRQLQNAQRLQNSRQLQNAQRLQNSRQSENAQRLQNSRQSENAQRLQHNYFEDMCILLLKLNQFKNTLNQLNNLMNRNRRLIESNNRVFKQQQNARQQIISNKLNEILSLIPKNQQLQQLYNYVKSKLNQSNINLLEVSTQLIQEITTLLKSNQTFLSFLETKPIEKSALLEILQQN